MNRFASKANTLIVPWLICPLLSFAQLKDSIIIKAGPQYDRSKMFQWLWGKHYREEWAVPVKVPYLFLDTLAGGLTPFQAGGGRQSKSLHLRSVNNKNYVLRSIDKTFGRAIPDLYQGTYIESFLNDQVSIGHPYAALTIGPMAEAARIYHTNPIIGFVPRQNRLDSFNLEFGNALYLFEQRPDENWEEAPNLGNSKNIIGTEKVLEKIFKDNDNEVDQLAFVRARLFDMLIGDWSRHEDQWRWAEFEKGDDKKTYMPIPRDRDQVYTKFDGLLVGTMKKVLHLGHLQTFDYKIKNVKKLNYPARHLDRKFATEPSLQDWMTIAKDLQARLTDSVIETSVKQLPPEIFPISGREIISKLKSRRDRLPEYATKYYKSLAKEVEVVGTDKDECFEVTRLNDDETSVIVYKIKKGGEKEPGPIYSRVFKKSETNEVRLYGLRGNDVFYLSGDVDKGIKVRIIGGPEKDSIINNSIVNAGTRKVEVYDDSNNVIENPGGARLHISNDSSIHEYHYDSYVPDKSGFRPSIFYSNEDRLYVSLGYMVRKNKWRKFPFAYEHGLYLHYSLIEAAPSLTYKGVYNQVFGKWNLALNGNYDAIRWTNFYGLGNETTFDNPKVNYYRTRTREYSVGVGLFRPLGKYEFLSFNGFYQNVKIIDDAGRFLSSNPHPPIDQYKPKSFAGIQTDYSYSMTNDPIVPSRGADFFSSLVYVRNLQHKDSSFLNLSASFNTYFQLSPKFIFVFRGGAATLAGHPEFYQYNAIGGSQKLRGYRRTRFMGKTSVFNNNELQWVNRFRSRLFNGKAGLVAFYDIGRVWMPGESSSKWHPGYGGGILLAPFNRISATLTYGFSSELSLFHIRINKVIF